jgi:hypothetical protein
LIDLGNDWSVGKEPRICYYGNIHFIPDITEKDSKLSISLVGAHESSIEADFIIGIMCNFMLKNRKYWL